MESDSALPNQTQEDSIPAVWHASFRRGAIPGVGEWRTEYGVSIEIAVGDEEEKCAECEGVRSGRRQELSSCVTGENEENERAEFGGGTNGHKDSVGRDGIDRSEAIDGWGRGN